MRWLGKNWQRLHRLAYLAVPLAVLHYWQREKFLTVIWQPGEQPDFRQPIFFLCWWGCFYSCAYPLYAILVPACAALVQSIG